MDAAASEAADAGEVGSAAAAVAAEARVAARGEGLPVEVRGVTRSTGMTTSRSGPSRAARCPSGWV